MLDLSELPAEAWRPPILPTVATDRRRACRALGRGHAHRALRRGSPGNSPSAALPAARGAARDRRRRLESRAREICTGDAGMQLTEASRRRASDPWTAADDDARRRGAALDAAMTVGGMADGPTNRSWCHSSDSDDGVAVVTLDNGKVNALSSGAAAPSCARLPRRSPPTRPARSWSRAANGSSPPAPTSPSSAAPTRRAPITAGIHGALDAVAAHPALRHRRGQRLRPRRRLRAGAGLRLPDRRRAGRVRPARDPARHHPRWRRHAAPGPRWSGRAGRRNCASPAARCKAEEALRIGLADEVVPHDELHARALALAAELRRAARSSPQALAKQAIDDGLSGSLADGLAIEQRPVRGGRSAPTTARSAWPASSNTARARPPSPGADRLAARRVAAFDERGELVERHAPTEFVVLRRDAGR